MNILLFGTPEVDTLFRPVDIEDVEDISRCFARYPSPSCDYSLTGLIMWRDYYDYHIAIIDDTLFIRGLDPITGLLIYYMPSGPIPPDLIMRIIRDDAGNNEAAIVDYRSDWLDPALEADIPASAIRMPHWDDYCYDIRQFTHFEGRKMEKKRNHLNFFRNHFPEAEIRPITAGDFADICIFAQSFGKMHEESPQFRYENEHCIVMLPLLGRNNLFRVLANGFSKNSNLRFSDHTLTDLVKACYDMGAVKTGALIVIEMETGLQEYERTGIPVDAILSRQLLINIFEKNTPLHDGAVLVRGDRVVSATCYLPLSDNMSISKDLGTRHRAALGISEVSDAVTIVVSEETGKVSVTQGGKLRHDITAEQLTKLLHSIQKRRTLEDVAKSDERRSSDGPAENRPIFEG